MFDICKIRGGNWLAEIAPDIGANILRLQHSGKDVLVPLRSPERLKDNPYLQGAPILLPANRTANGEFIFENKKYFLPVNESGTNAHLHGLVHRQPFCVEKMIDNEITLFYENKSEIYPFAFRIEEVRTRNEKAPKIPDVCDAYQVECIDFVHFAREVKFAF